MKEYSKWTDEQRVDFLKNEKNRIALAGWFQDAISMEFDFFLIFVTATDGVLFSGPYQKGETEKEAIIRITKESDSDEYYIDGKESHPSHFITINVVSELKKVIDLITETGSEEDLDLFLQINKKLNW